MIYRTEKGKPLTLEEVDGNFRELDLRLKLLESLSKQKQEIPESVASVVQKGDILCFVGSRGSILGTASLPRIIPSVRGSFKKGEYYNLLDFVVYENKTYSCTKSHIAETFLGEGEFWQIIIDPKI